MAGIQLVQAGGAGTLNAGGTQTPAPFTGVLTGLSCVLAVVGTVPTTYAWALAVPTGSTATLSTTSGASPTFTPDKPGNYAVVLTDQNGVVYSLQLAPVAQVAGTVYTGPLLAGYLTPSQVAPPPAGESLFCDRTAGGAISAMLPSGTVATFVAQFMPAMQQLTWFIDSVNGSDSNDGASAQTPIKTDAERIRRMGVFPTWNGAYHLRYINDIDAIELRGVRAPGAVIFVHGSATDCNGQSALYSGTIDAITALNRTAGSGGQPILITSNGLGSSTGWTTQALIGSRVRRTSDNAMGWPIKDLGSKQARFCEWNVGGTFTTPFVEPNAAATPALNDAFVVEKLTKVNKVFVNLVGGRGATDIFGVVFDSLDIGTDVLQGLPCENIIATGCIVRNTLNINGTFQTLSLDACRLTGTGATWNNPKVIRFQVNGGYCDLATTIFQPITTGQINRFMAQGGRLQLTSQPGNDIQAQTILSVGIFDSPSDGLTLKSPQSAIMSGGSAIIWGSGNGAYGINFRAGASLLWNTTMAAGTNFNIVGASGDVVFGNVRTSVRPFDDVGGAFLSARTLSFANILATQGSGGFSVVAGQPHFMDPVSGCAFWSNG